jgi:hypothetical protein
MPIKSKCVTSKSKRGSLCEVNLPLWKLRDHAKADMKKYPNSNFHAEMYKRLRNDCLLQLRLRVRNNVASAIQNANKCASQATKYKCLKTLTNRDFSSCVKQLSSNGNILVDPFAIASELNEKFSTVSGHYNHLFNEVEPDYRIVSNFVSTKLADDFIFNLPEPTPAEIRKYLKLLKHNASTGLDDISATVIKASLEALVEPLHHIISLSIREGTFPEVYKAARITAIPKDKFFSNPVWENMRPVSVLNTLSKVIEMHANKHVVNFFEEHHLFNPLQSGSRKRHSCETALLHITDICYEAIDKKSNLGILFTDFSKAFDLIDHSILMKKLAAYRFSETSLAWFKSYLFNRSQIVRVGGVYSDRKIVNCGVPQGSILGPLLFLIFTNDLPLHITGGTVTACVDDATILCTNNNGHETETNLALCSDRIAEWCKPNHQVLNPTKMGIMSIIGPRSKATNFNVFIGNQQVEQVLSKKLLGVTLNPHLYYNDHHKHIKNGDVAFINP